MKLYAEVKNVSFSEAWRRSVGECRQDDEKADDKATSTRDPTTNRFVEVSMGTDWATGWGRTAPSRAECTPAQLR